MPTTPDTRSLDREAVRLANPFVGGVAWPRQIGSSSCVFLGSDK